MRWIPIALAALAAIAAAGRMLLRKPPTPGRRGGAVEETPEPENPAMAIGQPVTRPAVYVQEVPSGPPTIVPVATSIAAFLGRARSGPTDNPVTIFNYGDFTRIFGGVQIDCPMSYAVRDFFANGGSQAIVVRLFEPEGSDGVARLGFPPASPGSPDDALVLAAASPGAWGNGLTASIDSEGISVATAEAFAQYDLGPEDLFNLTLARRDAQGRVLQTERFINLSVRTTGRSASSPGRLDQFLASESRLARAPSLPPAPPAAGATATAVGGDDGTWLNAAAYFGDRELQTGIFRLERSDLFNLLCIPPDRRIRPGLPDGDQDLDPAVRQAAADYCMERRAFYIVDPPAEWAQKAAGGQIGAIDPAAAGVAGDSARNAAVYFPRVWQQDPLALSQPALFVPCGAVAGLFAATDVQRGVWKAPAGQDAALAGVERLEVALSDADNGVLNPLGINCLRNFPVYGPLIWGARTLRGADQLADDYKYVAVRRLMLFIEESVSRGTKWAAFEPNAEPLWSSLRLSVGAFLDGLLRQGAFCDWRVACDSTTTSQADIDDGIVNIRVMVAAVDPAEFIVTQVSQPAGASA